MGWVKEKWRGKYGYEENECEQKMKKKTGRNNVMKQIIHWTADIKSSEPMILASLVKEN